MIFIFDLTDVKLRLNLYFSFFSETKSFSIKLFNIINSNSRGIFVILYNFSNDKFSFELLIILVNKVACRIVHVR